MDERNDLEKELDTGLPMQDEDNSYNYDKSFDEIRFSDDVFESRVGILDEYSKERAKKKPQSTAKGIFLGILMTLIPLMAAFGGFIYYLRANDASLTVLPKRTTAVSTKLAMLQEVIDYYYLFDYEKEDLQNETFAGFVDGLGDPYTCYYTEEEYKSMMETSQGSYYGIGVMISQKVDTGEVYIVRVFSGGPALEAGMQAGDIVYTVAGTEVTGMDLNEVVSMIKGAEGTKVEIVVYRPEISDFVTMQVERREVDVDTVYWSMKEDGIGYIELTEFDAVSTEQFEKGIEELKEQGMKALLVDLRNNPGGLLDVAVDIADIFIDTGKVVSISDKYENEEIYEATEEGLIGMPVVVLVNGDSASASEVLSGCLKDYGAATLVGSQTFGKGIVQKILPFGDGTAIKITIAHYYTPNGTDIHGVGITPDVVVEDDPATKDVDEQMEKALEVLKGMTK